MKNRVAKIFVLLFLACACSARADEPSVAPGAPLKEVLTLEDCVNLASRQNPEIQVSSLVKEMADEDVKTSLGGFFPTITGGATYWHVDATATLPVIPGSLLFTEVGTENNLLIGATAIQPVYDGAIWASHKLAKKQQKVAGIQKEMSDDRALANVKKAFYLALYYKDILNYHKEFRETSTRQYDETQDRYKRGTASALEVSQAEGAKALTQSSYQEILDKYETAKDQLKRLIGYPVSQEIVLKGDLEELTRQEETAPAAEPPSGETSPQLQLAEGQYELAKASTGKTLSQLYPRLYGNFNLYLTNPNFLIEPNNEFNLHYWVGAALQIPIFDGLRTIHQYHKAKAQEKISFILKKEIENQDEIMRRSKDRLGPSTGVSIEGPRKSFAAAKKAYEVSEVAHRNRLISYGEWARAQRSWAEARAEFASAQLKFLTDRIDRGQFTSFLP